MTRIQLSSTFPIEEVHLILLLARTLQRGGDVSVITRHPAWQNLIGKFQRMEEKNRSRQRPAHVPVSDPIPAPVRHDSREPPEKALPDPLLEGDLQKNLGSDPTRQHFLNQGYAPTEVEVIMRQLKKDEK